MSKSARSQCWMLALAWAIDNDLTRLVSLSNASFIAMVKGLAAGSTNLLLAWKLGSSWPEASTLGAAALLGFLSYGASLVLFAVALRHLGTARTGAYFSVAPFFGALLGVLMLEEPVTAQLLIAGALMAVGVWLHLTESHGHLHTHESDEHSMSTSTICTTSMGTRMELRRWKATLTHTFRSWSRTVMGTIRTPTIAKPLTIPRVAYSRLLPRGIKA